MDRAGHFRRLSALLLLACSASGCTYAGERLRDFGDMFRVEGRLGLGLQVDAEATELLHLGVGSSRHHSAGLTYGHWETRWQVEDHFPLSYIYTIIDPAKESLHSIDFGDGEDKHNHRCYVIGPAEFGYGDVGKETIHYFDIEVGFLAAVLGLEIGFSFGEFLDWLLGLFKFSPDWTFFDIAGDDPESAREGRKLWVPRVRQDKLVPK